MSDTSLLADGVKRPAKISWIVVVALVVWLGGVVHGFLVLDRYKTTPGQVGHTPFVLPRDSDEFHQDGRPHLFLFLHPKCPCSKASLAAFADVMSHCPRSLSAEIVFVRPDGVEAGWEQTPLWQAASTVPGVRIVIDNGGKLARALGAETSGHALLYGADDRLLFSGGITRSRGHEGDNSGRRALSAALGGESSTATNPVFGCPLFSPEKCSVSSSSTTGDQNGKLP